MLAFEKIAHNLIQEAMERRDEKQLQLRLLLERGKGR